MSHFTTKEIEYLKGQRLGRLATISSTGEPHVVPVGYRYNPETDSIDIGGHNFGKSKKMRDMLNNPRVAFVVDDVLPPWQPRGIEVRGRVHMLASGGQEIVKDFSPEMVRISPSRIVSWGIDTDAFHPSSRKIE